MALDRLIYMDSDAAIHDAVRKAGPFRKGPGTIGNTSDEDTLRLGDARFEAVIGSENRLRGTQSRPKQQASRKNAVRSATPLPCKVHPNLTSKRPAC